MEDIFLEKKDLEELLKKKKMLEYERYKDYDIYDLFIDLLKDETIYNYGNFNNDIIAGLFDYVDAIRDSKDSWNNTYYAFKSDTALEDFSNKFSSLELRLKIMYYINININNIWSYKYDIEFIENECCRIINKTLNELEQAKYDYMPRPDFKKLLDDPNFLKEKTPSRRWREKQIKIIEDVIQIINAPVQEEAEEQMIVEQPIKEEQQEKAVFVHEETSILPEKREKFRYIKSNDPQKVESIEENIAIYVKNNQPTELCKYLFNNVNELFLMLPVNSISIYNEIERIWGKENQIKKQSFNQAWNRIKNKS